MRKSMVFVMALMGLAHFGSACDSDPATSAPDTSVEDIAVHLDGMDGTDGTATPDSGPDVVSDAIGPECEGVGTDTVCVADDPSHVYKTDLCGNATKPKTTCSSALNCEVNGGDGQAYCACPLTGETTCKAASGLSNLYSETTIIKERACASAVSDPTDFVEDCGFGTVCFQEEGFNNGEALCHRSINEVASDSPYYNHGCGMFAMWMRNPTNLAIDCRCRIASDGSGGPGGTGGPDNLYCDPDNIDPENGGFPAGPIINCTNAGSMLANPWPLEYGTGPKFNAWFHQNATGASWFSGDLNAETREMYGMVRWTNPDYVKSATVVAWDLDTGDRRIISGLYPNEEAGQEAFGSGYMSPKSGNTGTVTEQPLTGGNVLRFHEPDGMIYVYGGGTGESTSDVREIVRIDPATGERTLVWLAQNPDTGDITKDFGQCFRPDAFGNEQSVGLNANAFEVGPDGTFYLSFRGTREGDGIMTISADGSICTPISRWGGIGHKPGGGTAAVPPLDGIGAGDALQFPTKGLLFHDGAIHGVNNGDLYAFDPATGDRVNESPVAGTYTGMGFTNMFWDPTRDVVWAVGNVASHEGAIIDLTTGRREPVYGDSEYGDEAILKSVYGTAQSVSTTMLGNGNSTNYGAAVLDPDNNDIFFAVLKTGGLMKMELSTFNNYMFSW